MANGKPGAPKGNKNGTKSKFFSDALRHHAAQNPDAVRRVVDRMFQKAEEGDVAVIREIFDRLEGKAPQSVDLTNSDGTLSRSLGDVERAARLAAILDGARERGARQAASGDGAVDSSTGAADTRVTH